MRLKKFAKSDSMISISSEMTLDSDHLRLTFQVEDPELQAVGLQSILPTSSWQRRSYLWEQSCLEAFWSQPGKRSYWEFNFSPQGFWNLYFFNDYRDPSAPVENFEFTLQQINCLNNKYMIDLKCPRHFASLEANLCAVVYTQTQALYYASEHLGSKPDFHLRKSFIVSCLNSAGVKS